MRRCSPFCVTCGARSAGTTPAAPHVNEAPPAALPADESGRPPWLPRREREPGAVSRPKELPPTPPPQPLRRSLGTPADSEDRRPSAIGPASSCLRGAIVVG